MSLGYRLESYKGVYIPVVSVVFINLALLQLQGDVDFSAHGFGRIRLASVSTPA